MEENFKRNAAVISGIAAVLRLRANSNEYRENSEMFRRAHGEQIQLEDFLEKKVIEVLGSDYSIGPLEISEGSVVITFLIVTSGTIIIDSREYVEFLAKFSRGVDIIVEYTRGFISAREWSKGAVQIRSSWQLGSAFELPNQRLLSDADKCREDRSDRFQLKRLLMERSALMWMVTRDALLLALILWLLLRHKL